MPRSKGSGVFTMAVVPVFMGNVDGEFVCREDKIQVEVMTVHLAKRTMRVRYRMPDYWGKAENRAIDIPADDFIEERFPEMRES